jgi:hypothetical protein
MEGSIDRCLICRYDHFYSSDQITYVTFFCKTRAVEKLPGSFLRVNLTFLRHEIYGEGFCFAAVARGRSLCCHICFVITYIYCRYVWPAI